MVEVAVPPPAPLPPAPAPAGAAEQRVRRKTGQLPGGPADAPSPPRAELRRAWRSGRVEAALQTELAEAEAQGGLQAVTARFPAGAARLLEAGQELESFWAKVVTQFGGARASISLQFVLKPRRGEGAEGAAAPERRWHFLVRARELGRTSTGDEEERHWAARLVLAARPRREDSVAVAVPDHRSIWPDCREVHSEHALAASDAALEALRADDALSWDVAVTVRDAGAPVEGAGRDFGDCC